MNLSPLRKLRFFQLAAACALAATPALQAAAVADASDADVTRLTEVEVNESKASAQTMAVTESKLDVMQPQSTISAQTINNTIAPTADYATIANIAASVANVETNGPGLSESKMLSMRGFQDGSYNVTFDGIPFGDANGPSHHTTSYFPAKILGGTVIDRGPGTADTMGEATFGGTIGLLSKDPRHDQAVVLTVSDGSWNSLLGNLEINTGDLPKLNGGSLVMAYQYMSSDGYRSFSYMNRNTYYLKYVQPLGKNTTLTAVGTYNNIKFNNPTAITQAQINQYGRNFGLDANPFDPNNLYYPYNYQSKQADMEYIGIKSEFGAGFSLDNKSYTYAYNNDSHESSVDPVVGGTTKFPGAAYPAATNPYTNNSPTTLPGTGEGTGLIQNDDPGGQYKVNAYRAFGNDFILKHEDTFLTEEVGVWAEYIRAVRYNYYLDYSPAYAAANPTLVRPAGVIDTSNASGSPLKPGYSYFMHLYNKTFQPFVDVQWHPIANLTIEAGVKFSNFTIDTEADVNQTKAQLPLYYNATYKQTAPNAEANYLITPHWSVYAQIAEGMLFPNVSEAEVTVNNPKDTTRIYNPADLKEETALNYQLGTVYKTDRFNADVDVYMINVDNLVSSVTDPADANNTLYFNSKGGWFSGVEAEATFYLGNGLSVYANGSLNRATYKTQSGASQFNVAQVPQSTASMGLVYNHKGWFGAIADKYIGPFVVYSSALVNPDLGLYGQTATGLGGAPVVPVLQSTNGGYSMVDLSGGYGFKLPAGYFLHSIKLKLQLDNVTNKKEQIINSVKASGNTFNVLPTTSYFVTLSTEF